MSHLSGVVRRLDDLTDAEMLDLHREVCRRAAAIYEPLYREKQQHAYRLSMAAASPPRRLAPLPKSKATR